MHTYKIKHTELKRCSSRRYASLAIWGKAAYLFDTPLAKTGTNRDVQKQSIVGELVSFMVPCPLGQTTEHHIRNAAVDVMHTSFLLPWLKIRS